MNAKVEEQTDSLGWLKWLVATALVAVAVVGNSYYGEEPLLYRVIALIVILSLAAFVASLTVQGKAFVELLKEAQTETKKIVWPTRQETFQTTAIVLAVVALMSLLMFFIDWILNWAISALVG